MAGFPTTGGMPSTGQSLGDVVHVGRGVVMTLSRVLFPSQISWCVLPVFWRSTGDGPVASPPFLRGKARMHAWGQSRTSASSHRPSRRQQFCPEPNPQFQWQRLPADVVVEHAQDALQAQPVVHRLRAESRPRPGRQ